MSQSSRNSLLSGAPQNDFLVHLEKRDALLRLDHLYRPHPFERFRFHTALFKNPGKLRLQFGADKLDHRQAPQHVDRRIVLRLGAIQNGEMKRD